MKRNKLLTKYMNFTESSNTATTRYVLEHILSGLAAETGEILALRQKLIRDVYNNPRQVSIAQGETKFINDLKYEMGDVLWHLSELANYFEFTLEEVIKLNMKKLKDRQSRGVIGGSGDDR